MPAKSNAEKLELQPQSSNVVLEDGLPVMSLAKGIIDLSVAWCVTGLGRVMAHCGPTLALWLSESPFVSFSSVIT